MIKKLNKILVCLMLFLMTISLVGCKKINSSDQSKITIVTTLFPEYEFINSILEGQKNIGKQIEVILIVPYGIDSHSFDPSIADAITIKNADLFIYTSDEMEPWVKTLNLSKEKVLNIYDAMCKKYSDFKDLGVISQNDDHKHEHHHNSSINNFFEGLIERINEWFEKIFPHDHHEYDPHFWTNMLYAEYMVEVIYDRLIEVIPDPDGNKKVAMEENKEKYIKELRILDQDFFDIVEKASQKTLYFGAPFAFYYFTVRYGLEYILTYSTCSTEIDPSLVDVIEVVNEMKKHNAKYIITKELTSTDAAKRIANYTGAEMIELHSGHNISSSDAGTLTFLQIMRRNTQNLAKALEVDLNEIKDYGTERGVINAD